MYNGGSQVMYNTYFEIVEIDANQLFDQTTIPEFIMIINEYVRGSLMLQAAKDNIMYYQDSRNHLHNNFPCNSISSPYQAQILSLSRI